MELYFSLILIRYCMYRIGGRLGSGDASCHGVNVGIPPLQYWVSNRRPHLGDNVRWEFDGGRSPRKGYRRRSAVPQNGWKPFEECKGRRELTATPTGGAGTKVDLAIRWYISGIAIAQRIKATLGITGLSPQEFTSTEWFGTSMSAHRILGL